jgi:Domain of unknown function (DUF5655)
VGIDASIQEYFEGKPKSHATFQVIADRIASLGPCDVEVASQISFGVTRKFAWFWLYNVTRKNPDGVPHLMLALPNEHRSAHVRNIEQIGAGRWNHQIVIRTNADATSEWLRELLEIAYSYGTA